MKRHLTLVLATLALTACNSVQFTPEELESIAEAPVLPPPTTGPILCLEGEVTWAVGGRTQVVCGERCWDGSSVFCEAHLEKEMVCENNQIRETGRTRTSNPSAPVTSCPVRPTPPPPPAPTPTPPPPPPAPVYQDVTENFTAPGPGKADILVILDTTPSMDNDLNKLASRLNSLTKNLQDVDWQIAITNAGMGRVWHNSGHMKGQFMTFQRDIMQKRTVLNSKQTPDYYFYYTVGRTPDENSDRCAFQPFCMTRRPEPMGALMMAIDKRQTPTNNKFFRKDAWLVPLIITDSDENEYGDHTATQPSEVLGHFSRHLGGHMKGMVSFGITIKPGDKNCLDANNSGILNGGAKYANLLNQFFSLTDGTSMSLCDANYGPGLQDISQKVRDKMSYIELKHSPATAKIEVSVTPKSDLTWQIVGQRLIFSKPLPVNAKVQVKYQILKK